MFKQRLHHEKDHQGFTISEHRDGESAPDFVAGETKLF
jgi:hypothetical protein